MNKLHLQVKEISNTLGQQFDLFVLYSVTLCNVSRYIIYSCTSSILIYRVQTRLPLSIAWINYPSQNYILM